MARRTRRAKPLPEPADATFTVLLRETAYHPNAARRRRAWAQLIDHLIADERDADQDDLRGLIAYCHERIDLLNSRDADFIVSVKRVVERDAVTPQQRRCALNIVHRLLVLGRGGHQESWANSSRADVGIQALGHRSRRVKAGRALRGKPR